MSFILHILSFQNHHAERSKCNLESILEYKSYIWPICMYLTCIDIFNNLDIYVQFMEIIQLAFMVS